MKTVYLIGSLRNHRVPEFADIIRASGFDVFDDWYAAGPTADDSWQAYEEARGKTYPEALNSYAAKHVFEFDKEHLLRADIGVLLMPAGKSGHLELGWIIGKGKPGFVLFPDGPPERWDVMYQFASGIFYGVDQFLQELETYKP
jgi:nucleoside 2-deoxyribosyltransferase